MGTDAQCIVDPCAEGSVKKLKKFFGSDGSIIQSDHVCKFKHSDTTRALTTLKSSPIRQPHLLSPLTDGAVGMRRLPRVLSAVETRAVTELGNNRTLTSGGFNDSFP